MVHTRQTSGIQTDEGSDDSNGSLQFQIKNPSSSTNHGKVKKTLKPKIKTKDQASQTEGNETEEKFQTYWTQVASEFQNLNRSHFCSCLLQLALIPICLVLSVLFVGLFEKIPDIEMPSLFNPGKFLDSLLPSSKPSWELANSLMDIELATLEEKFPCLNEEKWLSLKSSAEWIITEDEPRHPSSIVVLKKAGEIEEETLQLISEYGSLVNDIFSQILNKELQPIFKMDETYFDKINGRTSILHADLANYFELGGRVVVVNDIDKISNDKDLLAFHALCDDYSAPEKRALFIFILEIPEAVVSQNNLQWTENEANEIAQKTLDKVWSNVLSENYRAALIARVLRDSFFA